MQEMDCCGKAQEKHERLNKVMRAVESFRYVPGALIPVLHEVQEVYGYLPEEVLQLVSHELAIPLSEIYGVASFYHFFSLAQKGRHVVRVCLGTACYVKGSHNILERLRKELNAGVNETTDDGEYTLEATRCLGACGLAPVMTVGEQVYGRVSPDEISRILRQLN